MPLLFSRSLPCTAAWGAPTTIVSVGAIVERNTYSSLFYVMLVIGIIGVIGFLLVALSGAQGRF
jgi:hypothetical protein